MAAAPERLVPVRLALLGAASAVLQTLFTRELLSDFTGNEAVIAALLGPWLVWTALGARAGRGRRERGAAVWLLAFAASAVACLVAARALPRAFELGAAPGAATALGAAALLLAAPCFCSGMAFSRLALGAGRAWLAESLGSALGGAALSLVLLGRVPAFALLAIVVAASTVAAAAELSGARRWIALAVGCAVALAVARLGTWALRAQGPQLSLAMERDSASASLVTAESSGQVTLFADRIPLLSGRDLAVAEEAAHVPLALVARPRRIAVIGVAPAGALAEIARHGAERVDLVLDDAAVLEAVREIDPLPEGVQVEIADARRLLLGRAGAYDAVLLFAPEPSSAQLNRLYTQEFFAAARGALAPGGLFALSLPGHAAYPGLEKRRLHSSLARTLEAVFGTVRTLPLGRTVYLAAEAALPAPGAAAEQISSALTARGIAPTSLTRAMLASQLTAQRVQDALRWASLQEEVNRDLRPTTYRIALDRALAELGGLGTVPLVALALALALGALLVLRPRSRPVEFAVLTSGAAGLSGQLVVMLAYQIAAGALYREIGLLLAGFMLGAAAGAWSEARGWIPKGRGVLVCDLSQIALFLGLSFALPGLVASGAAARPLAFVGALGIGLLPGAQFASAGRALGDRPAIAATLYAADLFGAAIAALVTFTVLVPSLGLPGTLLAIAGLKVVSSVALVLPRRDQPDAGRAALAPAVPALLVAGVVAAAAEQTEGAFYAFTFWRPFQILVALTLLAALLAAFEPLRLRTLRIELERRLGWARKHAGVAAGRLVHFALLLPVGAFPLGRCYFQVPYLFCHVCPRPCVFGVMRPYLVPAAVLANLYDRRFCERVCPLGTAQAACEGVRQVRSRRVRALWLVRLVALVLVAIAYFLARDGKGEGLSGGGLYELLFRNAFTPSAGVLLVAAGLLLASLFVRRPFCEGLCPIGGAASLLEPVEKKIATLLPAPPPPGDHT